MSVEKQSFGTTKKGEAISLYTVTNKNGMVMKVTDFGAILVSVLVPDKNGVLTDVVLGSRRRLSGKFSSFWCYNRKKRKSYQGCLFCAEWKKDTADTK